LPASVGIAGTGKMGTAIACNLLERGYRVAVWNVDSAMTAPSVAAGAAQFDDVEALVNGVDEVVASLWDDAVARDVSLGRIIPAARPGQLFLEFTTLSPQMYETLAAAAAERGVDFIACPVIGSVDGARSGSLTLHPGGSRDAVERAAPLLRAIGSSIHVTGSPGASGHLKLAANCMLAVLADSLGELLGILRRAGVDRSLAVETLIFMLERVATKRGQLLELDAKARFSAGALLKDLELARFAREGLGVAAPLVAAASSEFERVAASGLEEEDYIAVALALERRF